MRGPSGIETQKGWFTSEPLPRQNGMRGPSGIETPVNNVGVVVEFYGQNGMRGPSGIEIPDSLF